MNAAGRWFMRTATRPMAAATARRHRKLGKGLAAQAEARRFLVDAYSRTEYGRSLGLTPGLDAAGYAARVPTLSYEGFVPWVERTLRGEADILWPGTCEHFAVSSGTTAGRTKYLPITRDMIAHFRRTGLESLSCFAVRAGDTGVFAGRHLFLGGSTVLERVQRPAGRPEALAGDLSGITALNLPRWAEAMLYEPGRAIAQMSDWPSKIQAIAGRTLDRDMTLLAGIPSWILVLVEELRRQSAARGRPVTNLRELWPHLRCLIHGGVPIGPYTQELREAVGPGVLFHEVYPASEAFIAVQDAEPEAGLRLLVDANIYYEFAPLSQFDPENPAALGAHAVPLEGVRTGVDYVLIMSTPAGLQRYIIGDVVRFLSTDVPRIVYAGRTRLQLSAFGEHVIERELTDTLTEASAEQGLVVSNFHVAPRFVDTTVGATRGKHEWWIGLRNPAAASVDLERLVNALDRGLSKRNDDYEAKRRGGGLALPEVHLVSPELFERWQKAAGKWGGQNKMPRCRSDREIADALAELR